MRIFLSLLPKYQNYTSVLASIMHLRSDAGFFVNPQRISETTLPVEITGIRAGDIMDIPPGFSGIPDTGSGFFLVCDHAVVHILKIL